MTDEEIVERAIDAEKRTRFGELVHSPVSNGVNSAYGIGFIEGMVEYRNSLQEEPVYTDFTKALAECIHQAQGSVFDPMVHAELWENELVKLAKSKEPVSEDLGDYINELSKQFPEVSFAKLSRIAVRVAKWQKQKDKTKVLTEEQCRKIRDDAFELGKDAMKQQLMKDAVEGEIVKDIANNLYIGKAKVNRNNFKFGDKVKLLVLREE